MDSDNNNSVISEKQPDDMYVRRLAASVVRRAPMDAANVLVNEPDAIVIAILQRIGPTQAQKVLRRLPAERAEALAQVISDDIGEHWELNQRYPHDTIGHLMEPVAATLPKQASVKQAIDYIREQDRHNIVFTYIYVVDDNGLLQGVIVMRDLLMADADDSLHNIMVERPFRFSPETSVQAAMLDVVHRHYPVYPVCDENGVLIVLRQGYIDGFSWSVSVQGKARLAANGHSPLQEAQRGHGR